MGYVEYDDAVWKAARGRKPVLVEAPHSPPVRCMERVMQNLLMDEQLDLDTK